MLRGAVRGAVSAVALSLVLTSPSSRAEAAQRPYLAEAQRAFDGLPARDRNEIFLELMATGDFNAMASNEFGGRLYDATASFQAKQGLDPTGVLTPETQRTLSAVGGRIFNSWGFEFLDHPFAPASVVVPGRFGLSRSPTQHGFALENSRRTMSVDFSFFPDSEATLASVFGNLTRTASGRRVDMKVIRPTFLAVAGGTDKTSTYSRYIVVRGGVAGFTLSWNNDAFPNGVRVAVVMANELYPRHMVSDSGQQADIFEALPGDSDPFDPPAPPDAMSFSGSTPTNAGADTVGQAILQTKQDAQRAAAQVEADRQAAYAEQQRAVQEAAAERRSAGEAAARAEAAERIRVAQQEETERRAKAEADRMVQQAEADRKAKAEQEARAAAEAQLKADRLARAVSVAKQTIADASAFVKTNRDDPQLVDHLGRIAELNAALTATDPEVVEGKTSALTAAIAADPAYAAFGAQRAADQQRETARYLGDAVRTLKAQRSFLVGAVAQDPTSPQATRFLMLAKQADAVLTSPDLDHAQTAMGTIEAAIKDAGLRDAYATASAAAKQVAVAEAVVPQPVASAAPTAAPVPSAAAPSLSAGAPSTRSPSTSLPETDRDRFLLDGGRDDVVLMVNASPKAPHVYRDLKGDIVFDRDQADVCLFGRGADPDLAGVVRSALGTYKLKQLSLPQTPCDGDHLDGYDVVAIRRGQFLRQDMPAALQLVGSVEAGTLKQLATVTPSALQTAQATEAVAAEAVAEDVARGTRPGFGFLVVADGVSGLCAVTPQDAEAHQRLLAGHADVLTAAMGAEPIAAPTTADGAFVSAKRGPVRRGLRVGRRPEVGGRRPPARRDEVPLLVALVRPGGHPGCLRRDQGRARRGREADGRAPAAAGRGCPARRHAGCGRGGDALGPAGGVAPAVRRDRRGRLGPHRRRGRRFHELAGGPDPVRGPQVSGFRGPVPRRPRRPLGEDERELGAGGLRGGGLEGPQPGDGVLPREHPSQEQDPRRLQGPLLRVRPNQRRRVQYVARADRDALRRRG